MNRLVTQYRAPLLAFFSRRSQNYWDAEELTQEVFCKILKADDINVYENQEAYLFTVAWSVLRDKLRHDQSRQWSNHVSLDETYEKEDPLSLERILQGQEQFQQFMDGLDKLPAQTRDIFLLSRYEGYTYLQIADYYGITKSGVEKYMMKALEHMNKVMEE